MERILARDGQAHNFKEAIYNRQPSTSRYTSTDWLIYISNAIYDRVGILQQIGYRYLGTYIYDSYAA